LCTGRVVLTRRTGSKRATPDTFRAKIVKEVGVLDLELLLATTVLPRLNEVTEPGEPPFKA
jgi:hypothetical protein